MLPKGPPRSRERGLSAVLMLAVVVITAGIASASVFANVGASREAQATLNRERAFQAAEAGIDWGITRVRVTKGEVPDPATETTALANVGGFTVTYRSGAANAADDDGDAEVDEADESAYVVVASTGTSGGMSRTLQVVMKKEMASISLPGTTYIDDESPLVDLSGNAFRISGEEHLVDGSLDDSRDPAYGMTSPADPAVLLLQLRSATESLVTGEGGAPSVGQVSDVDFEALLDLARTSATVELEPGTHQDGEFGTPTASGVEVVHCPGDLHLSGNNSGAGVLVVDGDLTITGSFSWTGIILVEGRVRMNGGGSKIRLVGAMAVGDEITDSLSVAGTVDLYFSSDAVLLAGSALTVPVVKCWRESATPRP